MKNNYKILGDSRMIYFKVDKKRAYIISILLLLFASCSKSNKMGYLKCANISQTTPISICVDNDSLSRGTPVKTEANMETMGIYCTHYKSSATATPIDKMANEKFTYSKEHGWSGENNTTWGYENITDKYRFYAYSPYSDKTSQDIVPTMENGVLKIRYTTPSTCVDQQDLLVATPIIDIHPQIGSYVDMHFNHTLFKNRFFV